MHTRRILGALALLLGPAPSRALDVTSPTDGEHFSSGSGNVRVVWTGAGGVAAVSIFACSAVSQSACSNSPFCAKAASHVDADDAGGGGQALITVPHSGGDGDGGHYACVEVEDDGPSFESGYSGRFTVEANDGDAFDEYGRIAFGSWSDGLLYIVAAALLVCPLIMFCGFRVRKLARHPRSL